MPIFALHNSKTIYALATTIAVAALLSAQSARALDETAAKEGVVAAVQMLRADEQRAVRGKIRKLSVKSVCDPGESMAATIPESGGKRADLQICLNHVEASADAAAAIFLFYQASDQNETNAVLNARLRSIVSIGAVISSGLDLKNLGGGRQLGYCRPVFRTYIAVKGLSEYHCETISANSVAADRMWSRAQPLATEGIRALRLPADTSELLQYESSVVALMTTVMLKLAILHELSHILEDDYLGAAPNLKNEIRSDSFARDMLQNGQSIDNQIVISLASFASLYHAAGVLTTIRKNTEDSTARTNVPFDSLQRLLRARRNRN